MVTDTTWHTANTYLRPKTICSIPWIPDTPSVSYSDSESNSLQTSIGPEDFNAKIHSSNDSPVHPPIPIFHLITSMPNVHPLKDKIRSFSIVVASIFRYVACLVWLCCVISRELCPRRTFQPGHMAVKKVNNYLVQTTRCFNSITPSCRSYTLRFMLFYVT